MIPGINEVGDLFEKGRYFLPQLIASAEAMKESIAILEPILQAGNDTKQMPVIVIATVAGMIAGGAMVFIWKFLIKPIGGVWGIYELLPAFLVSLAVIVVVSLCTKAPSKEIVEEFEQGVKVK